MSFDTPPDPQNVPPAPVTPTLRREALLPGERSRGMGTVAVVCTMAGVASGLALATTLMAMQVADSMSVRHCPYHVVSVPALQHDMRPDHGFLGIRYVFHDGFAEIDGVLPDTPAEAIALQPGDHLLAIDGAPIRSSDDLQARIYGAHPGERPTLLVERDGHDLTYHPTLISWPVVSY
jgi:S1-C subfamily serine protease